MQLIAPPGLDLRGPYEKQLNFNRVKKRLDDLKVARLKPISESRDVKSVQEYFRVHRPIVGEQQVDQSSNRSVRFVNDVCLGDQVPRGGLDPTR